VKLSLRTILGLGDDVALALIAHLPGPAGRRLRYQYWTRHLGSLGRHVLIDEGVRLQNPAYIHLGDGCWIDKGAIILAGPDDSDRPRRLLANPHFTLPRGTVQIGRDVHVGPYTVLSGIAGLSIGDACGLAGGVRVYSFCNHYRSSEAPRDRSIAFSPMVEHCRQYMIEGPIAIGDNVGLAVGALVLPGVTLGRDSFVKAGSVVGTSFAENSLVGGDPGQRLGSRFQGGREAT
jgi:acetyltransferase-like isoleucine patch superfamily enzyme